MVVQYVAMRPILNLYERSLQRPGAWVSWRWWEQEGIELEGSRERASVTSEWEEEKRGEKAVQEEMTGRI